jgi:hypothetical protein
MKPEGYYWVMARHTNEALHRQCDLVAQQKDTIKQLVALVDELRQPYNNSARYGDLYWKATNMLNDMQERELI